MQEGESKKRGVERVRGESIRLRVTFYFAERCGGKKGTRREGGGRCPAG